jgi:transcription initiation factor TFIIB
MTRLTQAEEEHDSLQQLLLACFSACGGDSGVAPVMHPAGMWPQGACACATGTPCCALMDYEYACARCGTVFERFIDPAAEWRAFSENPANLGRCGAAVTPLLPSVGAGTMIAWGGGSCAMMRVKRCHAWHACTYKDRVACYVFQQLGARAVSHGISSSILEDAKCLFKQLSDVAVRKTGNRAGVVASCVYIACKAAGVERTVREVADIFEVTTAAVVKACKRFHEVLRVGLTSGSGEDLVARFACKIGLGPKHRDSCRKAMAAVRDARASSSTPSTVAAAVIVACGKVGGFTVDMADVVRVAGVTSATISKCQQTIAHVVRSSMAHDTTASAE